MNKDEYYKSRDLLKLLGFNLRNYLYIYEIKTNLVIGILRLPNDIYLYDKFYQIPPTVEQTEYKINSFDDCIYHLKNVLNLTDIDLEINQVLIEHT